MSARAPYAALAVVMAGCFALLMWAGRGTTFFYDDWVYVLERSGWHTRALFAPHVDHLQVVSVFIYKVMFETVGLHEYWPYRAVLAVTNVGTGVLLFVYGRRRIGPWPSIALAVCLVAMAPSWYNLLFAFQINYVGACAAGLGALLLFDREPLTRRSDAFASFLLCVSIGSSSVGFAFLIAAIVEVLLRRDRVARLWVVAVPIVLYGLWRLKYGTSTGAKASNLDAVPGWILDGLDDSAAAIVGTSVEFGVVVAALLVALVIREVSDRARTTPRLIALIVAPLALWALTALGRADQGLQADENRYLYVTGLLLALLGMEAARRYALGRRAVVAITVLLAFGAVTNAVGVEGGGDTFRGFSGGGKDAATALDLAGHLKAPDFGGADPTQSFVKAGPYLAAVAHYGSSPGYTMEELLAEDPEAQRGVDQALKRVHGSRLEVVEDATIAAPAPTVEGEARGSAEPRGRCVRFTPSDVDGELDVLLPATGLVVRAGEGELSLWVRRFSPLYSADPHGKLTAGQTGRIEFGPDKAPQPWHARMRSGSPFEVCTET
ncbi:MAG TPA: hypothetical protein VF587_01745 [Solirubrobacteraceae bacterium]